MARMNGANLYILQCVDGSYYVGTTRTDLDARAAQHNAGQFGGYTATRRPVRLVFAQYFETITDAIAAERQIKGWSRVKKEALITGNWDQIKMLAQRRQPHPSRHRATRGSSG
jgi:putative endonuclease